MINKTITEIYNELEKETYSVPSTTWVKKVYLPFCALKATSGRLDKIQILETYKQDAEFKGLLKLLLDTQFITNVGKTKWDKLDTFKMMEPSSAQDIIDRSLRPFDDLENRIKMLDGTNESVKNFISFTTLFAEGAADAVTYISKKHPDNPLKWSSDFVGASKEIKEFIKGLATKTLTVGVDCKTVNKVYGSSFVPTFDVMLGTAITNTEVPSNSKIFISRKLNGTRCVFVGDNLYSRQGKKFTGCEHIIRDLRHLREIFGDYVFDGELLLEEEGLSDSEAFQKGTGLANTKDADKSSLKLCLFDVVPSDEFSIGESKDLYSERKKLLLQIQQQIISDCLKNVDVVPFVYEGMDHSKIWACLDYAENHDWEGVMINLDSPYECKRTKNLIKVKKFFTMDLKVIGFEEGSGKNRNKVGALVVDFKGTPVGVGSGLNDVQRELFWNNPDEILGKIIEVRYKEITKSKDTQKESLQFPVFIGIRNDKDTVSFD